jgi:hypothetical protein
MKALQQALTDYFVPEQACSRCGTFKPPSVFQVPTTATLKARYKRDFITTGVCDTCRDEKPKSKTTR